MRASAGGSGALWGRGLLWAALFASACAGPVSLAEGRWRARDDGASIADLAALEAGWRQTREPGLLLAFRAPDDALACWMRQCRDASAPARAEAHALLISLEAVVIEQEGAVAMGGASGWSLRARALERGRAVSLKAVTRAEGGCTDDFLLVTPGALELHEPAFDRWWATFEPGRRG
jgi:hypothetical protein